MTKKIVRLTESDLERIVRRVIKESMGVAFGGEQNGLRIKRMETKEQAPVTLKPVDTKSVVQKSMAMFPDPAWYKTAALKEIIPSDPNAVKAFNVYRRFFDTKMPQLSLNQGQDFFNYMKEKHGENVVAKTKENVTLVKDIFNMLIPTLQKSQYPNTINSDKAIAAAAQYSPDVARLSRIPVYNTPVSVLYREFVA